MQYLPCVVSHCQLVAHSLHAELEHPQALLPWVPVCFALLARTANLARGRLPTTSPPPLPNRLLACPAPHNTSPSARWSHSACAMARSSRMPSQCPGLALRYVLLSRAGAAAGFERLEALGSWSTSSTTLARAFGWRAASGGYSRRTLPWRARRPAPSRVVAGCVQCMYPRVLVCALFGGR